MTESISMTTRTVSDSFGLSALPASLKKTDDYVADPNNDSDKIEISAEARQLAKQTENTSDESRQQQNLLTAENNNHGSNLIYRNDSYGNVYATEHGNNNVHGKTVISNLSSPYEAALTNKTTSTSMLESAPTANPHNNFSNISVQLNLNSMANKIKENHLPAPAHGRDNNFSRDKNSHEGYKRYAQSENSTAISRPIGII
ncbi:hypothetical protein [Maridesulfovibrio bastinii]|uniref:hypothetical protein n=1 Tax=Maridesulfovibrio bastinii TaxID=47157 RepID=UPI000428B4AF|nr:hypothetical protein [Maridesulfovibrio bastinii]